MKIATDETFILTGFNKWNYSDERSNGGLIFGNPQQAFIDGFRYCEQKLKPILDLLEEVRKLSNELEAEQKRISVFGFSGPSTIHTLWDELCRLRDKLEIGAR